MTARSYLTKGIVLKKTKLGETDLIITLLAEDGSQIKGVAKGARKPSSSFASRLELFSIAELHCVGGRSLDIIKEARFINSNQYVRSNFECSLGAAPMVELLEKVTQVGLANTKLFPLTQTALLAMTESPCEQVYLITAAHLLKTLTYVGLRPIFDRCVVCSSSLTLTATSGTVDFSYREGGVVCKQCSAHEETIKVSEETCRWSHALLVSTIKEVIGFEMDTQTNYAILQLCHIWIREHIGARMKSLDYILADRL